MNVKIPKNDKPPRRGLRLWHVVLGVVAIIVAYGIWFAFIREVEAVDPVLQAPTLSNRQATASPTIMDEQDATETVTPVAIAQRTEMPTETVTDAPTTAAPATASNATEITPATDYRLYTINTNDSIINFSLEATGTEGTFNLVGHWFELIYVPTENGWRMSLWFDLDGNTVETGNGLINELMKVAFETEKYPIGRFVGESTTLIEDLTVENAVTLVGQVEISGQVRDLEVPVVFSIDNEGTMLANATFPLDVADFGVDIPESLGSSILDANIVVNATETDPSDIETTPTLVAPSDTDDDATTLEVNAPVIEADASDYRLFVFDTEQSVINFAFDATNTTGTFDLIGHWFEFVYVPEADAWRMVLWFDLDGKSVSTGSGLVDELMRVAFQTDRYPVGRFVGEATTLIEDLNTPNTVRIAGQVELSGQVRDLEVPINFSIDDGTLIASAKFQIDASDFGVDIPDGLGDSTLDSSIAVTAIETDPADIEVPERVDTSSENSSE